MTYFIPYRSLCVIYFDSVSNCSIPSRYHSYSPVFFTSCSFLFLCCFPPLVFTSFFLVLFNPCHHINSNRSLKQAMVEWESILKLNWVTTLLYPISPCRKGNYESAQQTVLVNCLYRRFEALCQRMIANWRGKQGRNWWGYKRSWCRYVKATQLQHSGRQFHGND